MDRHVSYYIHMEVKEKYTRTKHYGKLKQEWSSLDDYLKIACWYPGIPPGCQVL